jgi:hypothetical protein
MELAIHVVQRTRRRHIADGRAHGYWFAIETISMPSTADIGPLNDILCNVYTLASRSEANSTFHTGLLVGLRSRIVHDGRIAPIDGRIIRYLEYLYHDVLRHVLKLPAAKRLENLVRASAFDYSAELLRVMKN